MKDLIKKITLSKKHLVVGESLHVQVEVTDAAADVMIDGIYGANQFCKSCNFAIQAATRL